jgi:hypothetical protein
MTKVPHLLVKDEHPLLRIWQIREDEEKPQGLKK